MPLVKCKDCGNEVSTKAASCPQCGAPIKAAPRQYGCGTVILLFVAIGIWMTVFDRSSSPPKPSKPKLSAAECRQNLQCWARKHLVSASIVCEAGVERLAKHSHKWTDGLLEQRFSRMDWVDEAAGTVSYYGDKIQFQNGFGAWTNYIYRCDFDPTAGQLLDVTAAPGRI